MFCKNYFIENIKKYIDCYKMTHWPGCSVDLVSHELGKIKQCTYLFLFI